MIATTANFLPSESTNGNNTIAKTQADRAIPQPEHAPSIAILGIPFDNVTTQQTIHAIEEMVASRQPHYLVTANADFLVQSRQDVELRRILINADLVLCDGTPLVWASRLLGNPLPERVAGSDLVPLLLRIAEEKGYRVFFLGASAESASAAVANLQRTHSKLNIAGHYSPPFTPLHEMDHAEMRRRILNAKPDLLFVSFGCPKQEKWISMHYRSLGVPVCVGVGATIDFLAGRVKRAPKWMRKTGLEWIHRMVQEPKRLTRRYANCLWWFSREIALQWWRMQVGEKRHSMPQRTPAAHRRQTWKMVRMPDRIDLEAVRRDSLACEQALATYRQCLLDLSAVKFVDSTGIGLLIRLQKKARITGRQLILLAPSEAVLSALRLMRLSDFFVVAADIFEARRIFESNSSDPVLLKRNYFPSKPALFWRGEITAANVDDVWNLTQRHIASRANSKDPVQIDLSSLRFIDSAGVNLMLRARKESANHGTKVSFVGIQPNVRNVLRLSNLESTILAA